ncbi:peroxiredoxin 1-like [Lutzomyia longipalpis]|uniref:thioredoxin-dependent peroxiredoxin n=1 Tax=Lutzomyia longipalpis TaxID=7200 RepID=A0A1B0EZS8_LUTLO|nr:peroxiredoxin 1-like [Lutzomyia longipalpis]XP_055681279.1 peroxiredoxin 1-like [Lutzomyia longipalpis]
MTPPLSRPAPDFSGTAVINGQLQEVSLGDFRGRYLVLLFYPLDFTFVCPTEIIAFSERVGEFNEIGCEVVAISTDSHFSHLAWTHVPRKEGGLGKIALPLLSDKSMRISREYGVLNADTGIAYRGLFIIDAQQRLRQITVNDLPVGRSVDETLRLVKAFQYTDIHGEVCPANWQPGNKTINPDTVKSKEFFEATFR